MGGTLAYTQDDLIRFKPRHATFVGVDSDGCVFDTMEAKQKLCFHGLIVSHWGLERIEKEVRAAAEFVNLYSVWRGQNRFLCLLRTMDLLRDHPDVLLSGVALPGMTGLRRWIDSGLPLSNAGLQQQAGATGDPELASLLAWSEAVNVQIEQKVNRAPIFRGALTGLKLIWEHSDVVCVSQTPTDALVREWRANDVLKFVSILAGQELGTKAEHLRLGSGGKYPPDRVLMIGDAMGDWQAAGDAGAHFFPINPGQEEESWSLFIGDAYPRFLAGRYDGAYEDQRMAEFKALLPDTPPWKKRLPPGISKALSSIPQKTRRKLSGNSP